MSHVDISRCGLITYIRYFDDDAFLLAWNDKVAILITHPTIDKYGIVLKQRYISKFNGLATFIYDTSNDLCIFLLCALDEDLVVIVGYFDGIEANYFVECFFQG